VHKAQACCGSCKAVTRRRMWYACMVELCGHLSCSPPSPMSTSPADPNCDVGVAVCSCVLRPLPQVGPSVQRPFTCAIARLSVHIGQCGFLSRCGLVKLCAYLSWPAAGPHCCRQPSPITVWAAACNCVLRPLPSTRGLGAVGPTLQRHSPATWRVCQSMLTALSASPVRCASECCGMLKPCGYLCWRAAGPRCCRLHQQPRRDPWGCCVQLAFTCGTACLSVYVEPCFPARGAAQGCRSDQAMRFPVLLNSFVTLPLLEVVSLSRHSTGVHEDLTLQGTSSKAARATIS
jgi:hypothetical protein